MSLEPLDDAARAAIIGIVEANRREKRDEWVWSRRIGRLSILFKWRSRKCLWGRFGGGWQWKAGFCAGGNTIIFDLFVCSLRFSREAAR